MYLGSPRRSTLDKPRMSMRVDFSSALRAQKRDRLGGGLFQGVEVLGEQVGRPVDDGQMFRRRRRGEQRLDVGARAVLVVFALDEGLRLWRSGQAAVVEHLHGPADAQQLLHARVVGADGQADAGAEG